MDRRPREVPAGDATASAATTVRLDNRWAFVSPRPGDEILASLGYESRAYGAGGPRGLSDHRLHSALYRPGTGDSVAVPIGLVPRVVALLEGSGHRVAIVDRTPPRPGVGAGEVEVGGLAGPDAALAGAVAANRRGLILAPGMPRRVAAIATMARAFPRARFSVAVASRSQVSSVHDRLRRLVREPVALHHKHGVILSGARLKVCTWGSLDERASDLILFAEAGDALGLRFVRSTSALTNQHVFGFVGPGAEPHAREGLLLKALLGVVIHEIGGDGGRPAAVRVAVAKAPAVPIPGKLDALERKRRSVWHAGGRNAGVAEVAAALAEGREADLRRQDVLCGGEPPRGLDGAGGRRVAVLVESPEHARVLAGRLPGWTVLSGRPGPGGGELPARSILTRVHAHGLRRLDVDALVRADGSAGPLRLADFPPRGPDGGGAGFRASGN